MTFLKTAAMGTSKNGRMANDAIALFAILACALILRVYHLNHFDLWFDELSTDIYASQNIARMTDTEQVSPLTTFITRLKHDPHSALYYLVVHGYSYLFGDGKSLRVISVVFSMIALIVFYLFSRSVYDQRTGMMALLVMAFSPLQIWYAQEARTYALTGCLAISVIAVFWEAIKTSKKAWWIWFSVLGAMMVLSSYNSVLLLGATVVCFLDRSNHRYIRPWFMSMVAIGIVLLMLQFIVLAQFGMVRSYFWIPDPKPSYMFYTLLFYVLGYTPTVTQLQSAAPLILGVFGYGIFTGIKGEPNKTKILLAYIFLPMLGIYIISKILTPIYIHRQLLMFAPFFYLIFARGITGIKSLKLQMLVVVLIGGLVAASLSNYFKGEVVYSEVNSSLVAGINERKNYHPVMDQMMARYQEGDVIMAADVQSYVLTRPYIVRNIDGYYHRPFELFNMMIEPAKLQVFERMYLEVDQKIWKLDKATFDDYYYFSPIYDGGMKISKVDLSLQRFPRLWLVSSHWKLSTPQNMIIEPLRDYIKEYYQAGHHMVQDGVKVELFDRKKFEGGGP